MKTITKVIIAGLIAWPIVGAVMTLDAHTIGNKPYSMTAKLETKFALEAFEAYSMVYPMCENHGKQYSVDSMHKQVIADLKNNFNFVESDYEGLAGYVMANHMEKLSNQSKSIANNIAYSIMYDQLKNDCPKFIADAKEYVNTTFKNYIDKQK